MSYTIDELTDITPQATAFIQVMRSLRPAAALTPETFESVDLLSNIRQRGSWNNPRIGPDIHPEIFWIDGVIPVLVTPRSPQPPPPEGHKDWVGHMRPIIDGHVQIDISPVSYGMTFSDSGHISLTGQVSRDTHTTNAFVCGLRIPIPVWIDAVRTQTQPSVIADAVAAALSPTALAFEHAVLLLGASRAYDIEGSKDRGTIPESIHLHLDASISYGYTPVRYRQLLRNRGSAKNPRPDLSPALLRAYTLRSEQGLMPRLAPLQDTTIHIPHRDGRPSAHHIVANRLRILRLFATAGYDLQQWI